MGEGHFNSLESGKGFLEEERVLSDNEELELIGLDCKLGMTEARHPGQGVVPAPRAVWCWFCCMESGKARGRRCFGHGDELCLMSEEAWGSRTEELAEWSGLVKPHGTVGGSWPCCPNAPRSEASPSCEQNLTNCLVLSVIWDSCRSFCSCHLFPPCELTAQALGLIFGGKLRGPFLRAQAGQSCSQSCSGLNMDGPSS